MKPSTKFALIGLAASLVIQIGTSIWEINDYRKGNRRLANTDVDMIASAVVKKQEELKLAKKNASTAVKKEV